jgi:hypothetical protein
VINLTQLVEDVWIQLKETSKKYIIACADANFVVFIKPLFIAWTLWSSLLPKHSPILISRGGAGFIYPSPPTSKESILTRNKHCRTRINIIWRWSVKMIRYSNSNSGFFGIKRIPSWIEFHHLFQFEWNFLCM